MRGSLLCVSAVLVALLEVGCSTHENASKPDASRVSPDGDGGADADAALPMNLEDGVSCSISSQCRGGCCQAQRNTTTCAQIAPFDTTQNCACAGDDECAAIRLCGQPGFCQALTEPLEKRFCSRVCR